VRSRGQSSWLHNGDELCFLWGTNWIYICYVEESRPPLWSSGQSSWLQNGDVLCFLWGTNWIHICYVEERRPRLWSSGQSSWLHNGDVLCFLWGTNWIHICYVEERRPPLWSSGQSSWLQNGVVFCFLWGTNWIRICYVEESRPALWSSGQGSWLQIQRFGFDSRRYKIFWEAMGLERSPLSLVSTTEELLGRKSSGSVLLWTADCEKQRQTLCNGAKAIWTVSVRIGESVTVNCNQRNCNRCKCPVNPRPFL
jgi:hypothetical protein